MRPVACELVAVVVRVARRRAVERRARPAAGQIVGVREVADRRAGRRGVRIGGRAGHALDAVVGVDVGLRLERSAAAGLALLDRLRPVAARVHRVVEAGEGLLDAGYVVVVGWIVVTRPAGSYAIAVVNSSSSTQYILECPTSWGERHPLCNILPRAFVRGGGIVSLLSVSSPVKPYAVPTGVTQSGKASSRTGSIRRITSYPPEPGYSETRVVRASPAGIVTDTPVERLDVQCLQP
ncbi:MAG: hypothetical protein UZ13_00009 [Chloroflexi bacterium OLB13]|nr:MAG: hypothetical protein UZ13_00009 [Chloroflexi bacterium OLB13]